MRHFTPLRNYRGKDRFWKDKCAATSGFNLSVCEEKKEVVMKGTEFKNGEHIPKVGYQMLNKVKVTCACA
jgi:hypothetical protein